MARPSYHHPDFLLLGIFFFLIALGMVMLSSAGAVVGFERFGETDYFLKQQLVSFVVGLAFFFLLFIIDYHVWRKLAVPLLFVTIVLLLLVFVPEFNVEVGGAKRWVSFGLFQVQPSEVAKLAFLLYLSSWLVKHERGLKDFASGFLPFLILLSIVLALVVIEPDFGTFILIALMSIGVYFIAGAPMKHLFGLGVVGASLIALLIKIAPYRAARFTVFLNPELEPQGIGYHINQALLAIGSGGLFGLGLGRSRQKYNYLPEVTGDSIFAIIAEELGFLAVIGLIALFYVILRRGMSIARRAPDQFGRYLATGITLWITLQAVINIGSLTGVLPLTGITLPFISYGGSSLVALMAAVGILANISRQAKTAKS